MIWEFEDEIARLRADKDAQTFQLEQTFGNLDRCEAENARLRALLARCNVILSNMALESEGAIFISHEPLRADAKNILPEINRALEGKGE